MKVRHFLISSFAMLAFFGFVIWKHYSVDIEETLIRSAEHLNNGAPKMIDPHTDFIGARADGNEITYLYRVHGLSIASMSESEDEMRAAKLASMDADENMQRLLSLGVRMSFEFFVGSDLALRFSIEK